MNTTALSEGQRYTLFFPGDYVGTVGTTKGNYNLDDVLDNSLGQTLNELLEQLLAPQLIVKKH